MFLMQGSHRGSHGESIELRTATGIFLGMFRQGPKLPTFGAGASSDESSESAAGRQYMSAQVIFTSCCLPLRLSVLRAGCVACSSIDGPAISMFRARALLSWGSFFVFFPVWGFFCIRISPNPIGAVLELFRTSNAHPIISYFSAKRIYLASFLEKSNLRLKSVVAAGILGQYYTDLTNCQFRC